MVQQFLLFLTLQIPFLTVFCERVCMEKLEFVNNPEQINQNGSLNANGAVDLDVEVVKKILNARVYLGVFYGKDYKLVAFNRSVNMNKAMTFVGVTPLAVAIMALIKNNIDLPFSIPVSKVRIFWSKFKKIFKPPKKFFFVCREFIMCDIWMPKFSQFHQEF